MTPQPHKRRKRLVGKQTEQKIREILEKMVYADLEFEQHFLIDKIIDQALTAIKKAIEEK